MKVKKIILIVVIAAVLIGAGGVYAVNRMFDMLFMSQLDDILLDSELDISSDIGGTDSSDQTGTNITTITNDTDGTLDVPQPEADTGEPSSEPQSESVDKKEAVQSEKASTSKSPAEKQQTEESPKTVTLEKMQELKNEVSLKDKTKALSIVLSRLKPDDLTVLKDMASGGVTSGELEKTKDILRERVTEEEKDTLKAIFFKYDDKLGYN